MNSNNDYESFKDKLDQHEKIIEILAGVSSFIPNLYVINDNSDFSDAVSRVISSSY